MNAREQWERARVVFLLPGWHLIFRISALIQPILPLCLSQVSTFAISKREKKTKELYSIFRGKVVSDKSLTVNQPRVHFQCILGLSFNF
jgi:hypothetical protein